MQAANSVNREVTVALTQMACGADSAANIARAERLVHQAADQGANIILLQELFETPYFCIEQHPDNFGLAKPFDNNPLINHFAAIAKARQVVLPISYFEQDNNRFFNSLAVIDADGQVLGNYRKSHIPDGPGYQEKYYFTPGDTGFKVWHTQFGCIGVGICWDQWFPEAARAMALAGAELLFYPTAIGSEPKNPELDSQPHWTRVMQGHSAANMVPVIASNRVGTEPSRDGASQITFYGSSFITDQTGAIVQQKNKTDEGFCLYRFDLAILKNTRVSWGLFRDRRPELYKTLIER